VTAPTLTQLETLDAVAFFEGMPLPNTVSREGLRNAIRHEWVQIMSVGPGRYKLTAVGRLVRGRAR